MKSRRAREKHSCADERAERGRRKWALFFDKYIGLSGIIDDLIDLIGGISGAFLYVYLLKPLAAYIRG